MQYRLRGVCLFVPLTPEQRVDTMGILGGSPVKAVELWEPTFKKNEGHVQKARQALAMVGVEPRTVHAHFGGALDIPSPDPAIRSAGIQAVSAVLRRAVEIGDRMVIVHPSSEPIGDEARAAQVSDWHLGRQRSDSGGMNNLVEYLGKRPQVGAGVYLAPSAELIGDVTVGEQSSIWFGSVLRGDINRVVVGHHTNIQDLSVCHVADDFGCVVGNYVTVGHRVVLHACTIGDEVLVGMGAVVMDGVVVGEQSIIGTGALLTCGLQVPPGSLVYGAPAKVISRLGAKERQEIRHRAEKYCRVAAGYLPMIS